MSERPVVWEGMRTPWGKADYAKVFLPWIGVVGTPGHGGFKVSRERNALIPEYMRKPAGWYEEDCDWAIPVCVFSGELFQDCKDEDLLGSMLRDSHLDTFRTWHPDEYERFYGVVLQPGESCLRDERVFLAQHAEDLISVAAWGDWHTAVPAGCVGVLATKGATRNPGREEHFFLVTEAEYDDANRHSHFLIDPSRHPRWVGPGGRC